MKAILEFTLPDDDLAYRHATEGAACRRAITEMLQWLREQVKYVPHATRDAANIYQAAREQMYAILTDHGLRGDDD